MEQRGSSEKLLAALRLEPTGVPIYVQLRDQVMRAIAAGVLNPGDQMPTMRQVAVALRIDLNTVRHGYEELERAGAITLQRGRGSFVAAAPSERPGPSDPVEALARLTVAAAAAQGVDPGALVQRIQHLIQEQGDSP